MHASIPPNTHTHTQSKIAYQKQLSEMEPLADELKVQMKHMIIITHSYTVHIHIIAMYMYMPL